MEANKILQADVLDIVFEGRNKAYGAYDLRRTYNKRLVAALVAMMGLLAMLFAGYAIASDNDKVVVQEMVIYDPHLSTTDEKPPVVPPPPALKPPVQQVATIRYTPPIIVHDEDVPKNEMPPEVKDIEGVKIGEITQEGVKGDNLVAPPTPDDAKGIIDAPKKLEDDNNKIFVRVEVESQYPGGASAWMRYLNKTFHYPESAQEAGKQGTVIIQFIVDKEGTVSDVEAISGPVEGGLREEAVRVIQKSGKWEPAIQNGRKVKSYKKQPITFRLDTE